MTDTSTTLGLTGSHSFDFLHGRWRVHNRKLDNPLEPESSKWSEFEAKVRTIPALAGSANIDLYEASSFPNRGHFEAIALRLYDSESDLWRIWWASTVSGGQIDVPVVGRFEGNHGVFSCDDVLGERPTKVLYEWLETDTSTPRWRQSFSFDDGETWHVNWQMHLTR